MDSKLNIVPFVSVDHMMRLVNTIGVERFLTDLAAYIEEDFRRWELFDKTPRVASHSMDGVIELMPTSDGQLYGFKYVNGHPKNTRDGRQTVTAFGVLADVGNGYPMLLTEMTILTALRTAATSAVAAKYLAPERADTMAIIGNGAQSEFQALAFKAILDVASCGSTTSIRRPAAGAPGTSPAWASMSLSAPLPRRRSRARRSSPPPPPTSSTPRS